jgi:hypothetical protein
MFTQGILTERERINTAVLLVLTSSDKLLFKRNYIFLFYKTTYSNEEVNCTEPHPSVRVPWVGTFLPAKSQATVLEDALSLASWAGMTLSTMT